MVLRWLIRLIRIRIAIITVSGHHCPHGWSLIFGITPATGWTIVIANISPARCQFVDSELAPTLRAAALRHDGFLKGRSEFLFGQFCKEADCFGRSGRELPFDLTNCFDLPMA